MSVAPELVGLSHCWGRGRPHRYLPRGHSSCYSCLPLGLLSRFCLCQATRCPCTPSPLPQIWSLLLWSLELTYSRFFENRSVGFVVYRAEVPMMIARGFLHCTISHGLLYLHGRITLFDVVPIAAVLRRRKHSIA